MNPVIHTDAPYYYRRKEPQTVQADFTAQCAQRARRRNLAEGRNTIAPLSGTRARTGWHRCPRPPVYWTRIQEVLEPPRHPANRRRGS